jgi:hypothetical protein
MIRGADWGIDLRLANIFPYKLCRVLGSSEVEEFGCEELQFVAEHKFTAHLW